MLSKVLALKFVDNNCRRVGKTHSYAVEYFIGQGNRVRMQQLQQADWIAQQTREKELFKENQRLADKSRDEEALANYELLKQTQVEHDSQRTAMFKATQQANLQMA